MHERNMHSPTRYSTTPSMVLSVQHHAESTLLLYMHLTRYGTPTRLRTQDCERPNMRFSHALIQQAYENKSLS
jgi:hypothetical protein